MATKTQGLRIRTKLLSMVLLLVFISIAVGATTFYGLSKTVEKYQPKLLPVLEATHRLDVTVGNREKPENFQLAFSFGCEWLAVPSGGLVFGHRRRRDDHNQHAGCKVC